MPVSHSVTDLGPLFDIVTSAFSAEDEVPVDRQQLADAVAIAGLVAATGDQRRAVLLVRSGVAEDTSRFSPATVRSYLRRLGNDPEEYLRTDRHIVARGDTLWKIASRHATTVETVKRANGLRSNRIYPGQVLRVPAGR